MEPDKIAKPCGRTGAEYLQSILPDMAKRIIE